MCLANVRATLNEIECSIAIQNEGFENLVRGSQVSIEQVLEKAPNNWYIEAEDAKRFGLSSKPSFDGRTTTGIAEGGHDAQVHQPACFEQPYAKV
jgi:hypothetical protein